MRRTSRSFHSAILAVTVLTSVTPFSFRSRVGASVGLGYQAGAYNPWVTPPRSIAYTNVIELSRSSTTSHYRQRHLDEWAARSGSLRLPHHVRPRYTEPSWCLSHRTQI